jgi:DNA-binding CsgD family transcriptional regulator
VGDEGLECNPVSDSISKSYAKCPDTDDVESDVSSNAPNSTSSESTIPADLAVVIESWTSLTEKAKKKVLVIVKREEAERIKCASPYIGEPCIERTLEQDTGSRCTRRCTTIENDRDLARFIDLWPGLEQTQQQALLTLAGASKGQSGKQMESPKAPLSSSPSPRHGLKKTFSSPSSKELFNESEWSKLIEHLALPERQAEILNLLLHGENDKQIARKLKISQPTLRTHLQRMYGRFNVSNRTSLVVELVRLGRGLI